MDRIDDVLKLTLAKLEGYAYKTFLIGAILPSYMMEREDEIRAKFKIKGIENVKSYFTKELGKRLNRKTGKRVNYRRPDVTINVDLVKEEVTVRAGPIFLFGRYVKRTRGLNQKQERCGNCKGKGCSSCNNTGLIGYDSVEGIIVRKLVDAFKCDSAKFMWIGGEDKDSLVLKQGRPFFVKVINSKCRFARPRSVSKDGVEVKFIKNVERLPDKPLRFKTHVKLVAECECDIDDKALKKLNELVNTEVKFVGKHGKEARKNIYRINAKAAKNILTVRMVADGGLTIKQFVESDDMTPNISDIVGCNMKCKYFDILDVKLVN